MSLPPSDNTALIKRYDCGFTSSTDETLAHCIDNEVVYNLIPVSDRLDATHAALTPLH
jgi:hypothetical protein